MLLKRVRVALLCCACFRSADLLSILVLAFARLAQLFAALGKRLMKPCEFLFSRAEQLLVEYKALTRYGQDEHLEDAIDG